ncbi:MAG TPA: SprT family zinc-dependent metalloprotease [Candidatus Nanoperiomorbaceae bacterium]|nr:MAG: M48 family metallopeptidase [Candidatus Saccharibacteria bacterium]HMQ09560.1 SprT family zinc-dependent metalloprotease [Candidatus Nanoperiomorbaceae bacterium]HMQ96995.1 SprT family zinc-dependent metalloprotease [Candidatus Nanoperiomorbaceae bacterium]HMR86411.1 SprT family zinc-dependent metalloprotease [Candidatus Nanoperiomorbaceae bacterium]HMU12307.1 SprT family zinc-dependent metalloprotease [Candidatus Nanoperiomorbaceae bacterium]
MDRLFSSLSATAKIIHDDEFGDIHIKRTKGATISVRPKTDGSLVASLPYFVPVREIQRLINANRDQLRIAKQKTSGDKTYRDGDLIGKSHRLHISTGPREIVKTRGLTIEITLRPDTPSVKASQLIKDGVAKALRKEAKAYLPRRLAYLAMQTGFRYDQVRFTHAKSRWGSCSSNGTISLNIMLMTLPNELIDYVLLHELTHTKYMNHSPDFWRALEEVCPDAKQKRRFIKRYSPYL